MMRQIHLHGRLADLFGAEPIEIDVASAREAVTALLHTRDGFQDALRTGAFHVVIGDGRRLQDLSLDECHMELSDRRREIHIIPVVAGAKQGGGFLKVILGIALIGIGFGFGLGAVGGMGATAFSVGGSAITWSNIATLGLGMLASGVGQLLSPQPKSDNERNSRRSFIFSGAVNVNEQGVPVPLAIGRFRVGSVVASSGVSSENVKKDDDDED